MMGDKRFLVRAVVAGVNDTNVVYPCCIQCYSKMLHNICQNVWQCIRCNIVSTASQVTWRYRLSLGVADSSASCHVSLFGGTLIPYFGCSANDFHRFVLAACIQEDKIQQALELTLVGRSYLFGLKIARSPAAKQRKRENISRPVCLADLLNSHHTSNFHDGKLTDLIATQMIHVPLESQSSACLTIIRMLKDLISYTLISSPKHLATHSAESNVVSSNEKESHKSQNSSSSLDKISHHEAKSGHECRDQNPHGLLGMKEHSADVVSDLCSQSADLGWFTCDSSMERALSSQHNSFLPRSHQTEGIPSTGPRLSTSLKKSGNSFGILHAACSVETDHEKCLTQTLLTTRKSLLNTVVYTKRFQGSNQIYNQASAPQRLETSDHDDHKTGADDFSLDASPLGLESQHFCTQVCDDRMATCSWFYKDGEDSHSLSMPLNDSLLLSAAMVEETSSQNVTVGKNVPNIGNCVTLPNIGKSESASQEQSITLVPEAVKLLKSQNSSASEVICGSLREVERDKISSILKQKKDRIKNNLKSASHRDHRSINLPEYLGSGQAQESDGPYKSHIPRYQICSLDVDLTMPDSEDLSLFLNAAAIEMVDHKPSSIIGASKPKRWEQSQLECLQQQHVTRKKKTCWGEESAFCLSSHLALEESMEVHKALRKSHHKGFCQQIGLITSKECLTDEIIVLEDSAVIPENTLRLCNSETVTPPNVGPFNNSTTRKSTDKHLSQNILSTEKKRKPRSVNISLTAPSITRHENDEKNLVMKKLKAHCKKEDKNLHRRCVLCKAQMTEGTLKCAHDNVYLEGSSQNNLFRGKEDVLTCKTFQKVSSRDERLASAPKVEKQKSQIEVSENLSTSDVQRCFSLSKKEKFHSQNSSPFSKSFDRKGHGAQWLMSQNGGDNSHFFALMEPWYCTDLVQATEHKKCEKFQSEYSTGDQSLREQLMQSSRGENSSPKMSVVWRPSQPLTQSQDAGSGCTVFGEALSGSGSPHRFAKSMLLSFQSRVGNVSSHVQSDLIDTLDASADLFGSQSWTNASSLSSKGYGDEMAGQKTDKQMDKGYFITPLDNICNNAAEDLLRYRKCLPSAPLVGHVLHTPEWKSANMTALTQGRETFVRQEKLTPKCSTKRRVRFLRKHSRVSTIPSIDFLMAQYPNPVNCNQESAPTPTPLRSFLKSIVCSPWDHFGSPEMPTPDISKPTAPLDASTPMSGRKYWLSSPLDKIQNSGSQELYSPPESSNTTCIWVPASAPNKNVKTPLHHHAHKSKSHKRLADFTTLKWEQKEATDRRRLFHIPSVQVENISRRQCPEDSEDRHSPIPFCKTTNHTFHRHSIQDDIVEMPQDCLWQGQKITTDHHSSSSNMSTQLFSNAVRQENANTELVPAHQGIYDSEGSLVFSESDLDSEGRSQPFSRQMKRMTKRGTCSRRNTSRDRKIPSPRQRMTENSSSISFKRLAFSDCSPSLFSQ